MRISSLLIAVVLAGAACCAGPAQAQPFAFDLILGGFEPVAYGDVALADVDGDGDQDLLVYGTSELENRFVPRARLYRNRSGADGAPFAAEPLDVGLWSGTAAWSDADRDGRPDLSVAATPTAQPVGEVGFAPGALLWRGLATNAAQQALAPVYSGALAWGDVDNDGDQDAYVAGFTGTEACAGYLLLNQGDGTLVDAGVPMPALALGAASFVDLDGDGDLDLFATGACADGTARAHVLRNDGGTFTAVPTDVEGLVLPSLAWADADADGDLDALLTGGRLAGGALRGVTRLLRNDAGTLVQTETGLPGVVYGTALWADFDADGTLDVVLVGGETIDAAPLARVYLRGEDVPAARLASAAGGRAAMGDLDGDGDLEIVFAGRADDDMPITNLYRNTSPTPNAPPDPPTGLAVRAEGGVLTFSWEAASDDTTPRASLTYALRVGTRPGASDVVSAMAGPDGYRRVSAPGAQGTSRSWSLRGLPTGTYYWAVQAIDAGLSGSTFAAGEGFAFTASGTIEPPPGETPGAFATALAPVYPNPARDVVHLAYSLPEDASARLEVFDLLGRRVARVAVSAAAGEATAEWDRRDAAGRRLPAGTYVVRLQTRERVETRPLVLL